MFAQWRPQNHTLTPAAGNVFPISHFSSRYDAVESAWQTVDGAALTQPASISFAATSNGSVVAAPDQALEASALAQIRDGVTRVPVVAVTPPRPAASAPQQQRRSAFASAQAQSSAVLQSAAGTTGDMSGAAQEVLQAAAPAVASTSDIVWRSPLGTAYRDTGAVIAAEAAHDISRLGDAVTGATSSVARQVSALPAGLAAAVTPFANATATSAAAARQALTNAVGTCPFVSACSPNTLSSCKWEWQLFELCTVLVWEVNSPEVRCWKTLVL